MTEIPAATDFVNNVFDVTAFQPAGLNREIKKELGSDDFLQLLTTQMVNQDPLEPMDDTSFIAEMANFTSLEQMQTLVESFNDFNNSQQLLSSQNYIGMDVTWVLPGRTAEEDVVVTGQVEQVRVVTDGDGQRQVEAVIDGVGYDTRYIQEVRPPSS
ncbi:MAG: flagellar hook assembly protein FlgD [Opitutales bacterium]